MEEGSAMRSGTAAEPGGDPVSRPGPTSWASDNSWPFRSGAASCCPLSCAVSVNVPAASRKGGTLTAARSLLPSVAPAGKSRAAARAGSVGAGAGVS
ncbi:Uncharacterised protein [Klebsiella oxytoca]|nr:Uncharacterised protein [Klebsiella oxytoca]